MYIDHDEEHTTADEEAFFYTTLALVGITQCSFHPMQMQSIIDAFLPVAASGFIIGATMGLAARFPSNIIQGTLFGQALVGVACSVAAIAAQAFASDNMCTSGTIYFAVAVLYTIVSLLLYFRMTTSVR